MTQSDEITTATLQITEIPHNITEDALEEAFSDFGPLKRCFIVRRKNKEDTRPKVGYVEFAFGDDANRFLDSNPGNQFQVKDTDGQLVSIGVRPDIRHTKSRDAKSQKQDFEQQRFDRASAKKKKARLIIRNLSFKAENDDLRTHFAKCGEVVDVHILTRPGGKRVGCAFVQFSTVKDAAKAIKALNGTEIVGRQVAVDWAVSKKEYQSIKGEEANKVNEPDSEAENDPEEADEDDQQEDDENEQETSDEAASEAEDHSDDEVEHDEMPTKSHNLTTGHDVNENRTVFLRNLSFDTDESDLRQLMEDNFGPVLFAKLVYDKATEHPKGTAFVKFKYEESVQKCLHASETETKASNSNLLFLDDRRIYACPALTKTDVEIKSKESKKKEAKDSRNLHLAVEGLVRKGTQAAIGVSDADMEKRIQVEKWKRQMLKNLNTFVSPNRLCFRNVPPDYTDQRLKKLILKHSKKTCKLTEVKIMRDLKSPGSKATLGKSKGYAFVSFTEHEDALALLRTLNNNPKIFGKEARPIIEFSIENKKAIIAREKRLEKSKLNNPNFKGEIKTNKDDASFKRKETKDAVEEKPSFMGSINNPKSRKLPSHVGEKVRHNKRPAKISRKDIRKTEAMKKNPKLRKRKLLNDDPAGSADTDQEPKQKKKKKNKPKAEVKDFREEKQFTALVQKYKSKLNTSSATPTPKSKSKWFDA